jgi:D-tyrosyl-tRNA(Tyr) deacylase
MSFQANKNLSMRIIIQRVTEASVSIEGKVHASIAQGLLLLVGIHHNDTEADIAYAVKKVAGMRIFADANGQMNLSVQEVNGEILAISQFTLFANTRKGNRPSFMDAAPPEKAIPLYNSFCQQLGTTLNKPVKTGIFGADMKVSLLNDGPVTIVLDGRGELP